MLGRIRETDENVSLPAGWLQLLLHRAETGRQYPIYARKRGGLDGPEEVTLDLNLMSEGPGIFQHWGIRR
jgi:oligopeptidase B